MGVNQIEELVFKIVGAAMTVHNAIGHGLRRKTYERALVVEFQHLGTNDLKSTGKSTGLILNFKHPKLEWRKVTYNPSSPS